MTRRSDIPAFDHDLIGLAPWVTPECARAYLAASSREAVRTLVFYQPESLDTKKPPAADSAVWDLGDDGEWKKDNQYPVYAIPGPSGTELMKLLARYSGRADGFDFDIGDADNNDDNNSIINERTNLTEAQVQRSCTRLYALLDLGMLSCSSSSFGIRMRISANPNRTRAVVHRTRHMGVCARHSGRDCAHDDICVFGHASRPETETREFAKTSCGWGGRSGVFGDHAPGCASAASFAVACLRLSG